MVKLFGKEYSKEELLRRVGDVSQVGGVRLIELSDGKERGVRAADFRTGTGFNFTVLIDRGLDISWAEYKGMSLCWHSATTQVAPHFFEPEGFGWLRSFYGGLMVTCGLTYMGAPGDDPAYPIQVSGAPCCELGRVRLGLHGRASNTPATNVWVDGRWEGNEYLMWVQGKVREAVVFGECLELERRIEARLGERRLFVKDVVTNIGWGESPLMILYHVNLGFPLVDEGSKLVVKARSVTPRDEEAERGLSEYAVFTGPKGGFKEQVFLIDVEPDPRGMCEVALVNEGLELGVYLRYRKEELPYLTEWKMMGEGIYVVGVEPGNAFVKGRAKEREEGRLQLIKPGESRSFSLEIGILDGEEEIRSFKERCGVK